jgi:hypothetical protein
MVAVIVVGGYVLALLMGKTFPAGYDELARIVVVALFLTANGEHGGDHALANKLLGAVKRREGE